MSRGSSAQINETLTNYAHGLMNDMAAADEVINALCPTVVVPISASYFKKFDDTNSFQVYDSARGLGGAARRIEFGATDDTYNCGPQALEVTVDDEERRRAGVGNAVSQQLLDEGKVKALLNSTKLSHVKKIINYIDDNTTAVADRGNWSNKDIDPIDQLDEQLEALATEVGSRSFLTVTIGLGPWRTLRSHPKVKSRASGVKVGGITIDDLRSMLIFPVNVVIGVLAYNTKAIGQTPVKSQVVGSSAYLSYAVPNPTIYDPSPFKCFTTGDGNVEAVRTYRDESARSDVHAVDWSEDIKSVSTKGIRKLAIT